MDEPISLRWSGVFNILPSSTLVSKNLNGDKILLPQSALEQLLAASPTRSSTNGNASASFSRDPFAPYSVGPNHHENVHPLPNPLMFRLVNPRNAHVVYAGIREFSAPEGTLGLSSYLAEALGIQDEDLQEAEEAEEGGTVDNDALTNKTSIATSTQITVHAQHLPKGTYVRLRPLEAGYNPDDWKALLERHLRHNFTTLSKDAVLAVNGVRGEEFKFLVDKLTPEGNAICVVDTDLEVDIEALDEEQARETLRRIMATSQPGSTTGSSSGGEIDIWKPVEGHVVPGDYVDYTLPSWNRSQPLEIVLTTNNDDALDLFVIPGSSQQRGLPRDSAHVFGNFSPATNGEKVLSLSPSNIELEGAERILVSVHGYRDPQATEHPSQALNYTLRARVKSPKDEDTKMDEVTVVTPSADEIQCKNCRQIVPKQTMVLHENFCRRNNLTCPRCHAVFKKGSAEWDEHWHCDRDEAHGNSASSRAKHFDIFHTDRQCSSCEFTTNSLADLARHRTSVCPGKIILCRFCHLEVPQEGDPFRPDPEVVMSGMTAHELADGARTTECHLCQKIVRLRDMETHLKHHELDKIARPKPPTCRNANCGRTVFGVGSRGQIIGASEQNPGNDLVLCSHCFGPLYVSMHDPEGKALRRRIERRYLGQMMTGCGKAHCGNTWCKTGRSNLGLDAKPSSASAVLPLVKPLLATINDLDEALYFCVDESSQQRRKLAEMVAGENVWELEWCIAAAEAEKGNLDRMRDWLSAWAPTK